MYFSLKCIELDYYRFELKCLSNVLRLLYKTIFTWYESIKELPRNIWKPNSIFSHITSKPERHWTVLHCRALHKGLLCFWRSVSHFSAWEHPVFQCHKLFFLLLSLFSRIPESVSFKACDWKMAVYERKTLPQV